MYLESIKLLNFRLFNHNLTVENFCPGVNIFVGPNGSGKSSFFFAFEILIYGKLFEIKRELSKRNMFSETNRPNNYLMVELYFNNSEKNFRIRERLLVIRRLINHKIDKVWVSKYNLDTKKVNEFLISNGLDIKEYFLFLTEKDQSNFKISNSFRILEYFKKNSNLLNFSKNQFKVVILMKKATALKEKLSKIIKVSTKNKKLKLSEKKTNYKTSKINSFFILLEKTLSKFNSNFFGEIKDRVFLKASKCRLKIINVKNKENILKKNLFEKRLYYFSKFFFIKKNKVKVDLFIIIHLLSLISQKEKFLTKLEKYFSVTDSILSKVLWKKIVFINIKNTIYKHTYSLRVLLGYKILPVNCHTELKRSFTVNSKNQIKENSVNHLVYIRTYFYKHMIKKNYSSFFARNHNFTRDIFLKKKKSLLFLEQLSYEMIYVEKILLNKEKFLSNSFGLNISKSIRLISEFIRNKKTYFDRITGIVLDLISVYKYFEKSIEIFLWDLFPSLIVKDKHILAIIIKELDRSTNTKLNIMINKEYNKIDSLILDHPKIINLNSIIFSNQKISGLVGNLITNTYLCTESKIANKISKNSTVTTLTLDGEIYYSNGVISSKFLNSKNSLIRESVLLKKERNFLKWMIYSVKTMENFDKNFNSIYKNQRKFELVNMEITQFLLFQKNKQLQYLDENIRGQYSNLHLKKNVIDFLKSLIYYQKKFQSLKKKINLRSGKKIKIQKKLTETIKRIETRKVLKHIFVLPFLDSIIKVCNRKFKYNSLYSNIFKINGIKNGSFLLKGFIRKFFLETGKSINIFKFQIKNITSFLKNYYYFINKISIRKKSDICKLLKSKKKEIHTFKLKFLYLSKVKKKIQRFIHRKNNQSSKEINNYIFKLIIFYQNLENNLRILHQTFNVLIKEKQLKFKKISKIFSYSFQKNLIVATSFARSCFIWKEKRLQKVFKSQVLNIGMFKGVEFLIKFEEGGSFCLLENMSKGQICLSMLIFCITFSVIARKASFFFDEIDVNMDSYHENSSSKIIKKLSSRGLQFFIITHKKRISSSGDKWYGISVSKKGSMLENITFIESEQFLSIKI